MPFPLPAPKPEPGDPAPGPWKYDGDFMDGGHWTDARGRRLSIIETRFNKLDEHNRVWSRAHIRELVTAAPDMFVALRTALERGALAGLSMPSGLSVAGYVADLIARVPMAPKPGGE